VVHCYAKLTDSGQGNVESEEVSIERHCTEIRDVAKNAVGHADTCTAQKRE